VAQIADDKKGENIILLDLRKISNVTDFFVLCGSKSAVGVKAIAEEIVYRLKDEGIPAHHIEGMNEGTWVLADYGDIIVHVFLEQVREYYDLESFWGDAPRKSFRAKTRKKSVKRPGKKSAKS
jgi:ribosome-associated protein